MKEAAQCRQFDELRTGDGMVGQVIFFCKVKICLQPFQTQLYIFLSVLQEHHGACGKCSKGVKKDLLNNFENRSLYSQNIVLHITSMDGVRWCVDGVYVHIKTTKKRGGWWLGFEFWMVRELCYESFSLILYKDLSSTIFQSCQSVSKASVIPDQISKVHYIKA